jgi:thiosulfate/3-mercaptopyruvate sulfurtransferase
MSLASIAAGCGRSPRQNQLPDLRLEYPDASLFAEPEWLAQRLDNPRVRLLDCSDLPTYRRGHLPGARHVWWQDTIELHNPVYGMLVNPDGRAELARRADVHPDSEVVCYDAHGGTYAARVAWTLRYMGLRSTRLLVGGTLDWTAAGHKLTRSEPSNGQGGIADIFDESIVAHPQDILARLDEPGLVLLDTRTRSERGETWNDRLRHGVIPGSYWLPRDRFFQDHDSPIPLRGTDLLDRLGEQFNLDETAEIIVYGLHGTLASLPYHLILGLERFQVRLYDGSWSQWGADHSLPAEPPGA